MLSVTGSDTLPLFVEVAAFLRSSVPQVEERAIEGVGHLLHIFNSHRCKLLKIIFVVILIQIVQFCIKGKARNGLRTCQ